MARFNLRRSLLAVVGGAMVFSLVYAAAASLTVTSTDMAAGTATVAACDGNGVSTSFTVAFDVTDLRYEVSTVTVGGIADACLGQDFSVTLGNGSTGLATQASADVASWTTTSTDANTLNVSFSGSNVAASAVTAVYVSISD